MNILLNEATKALRSGLSLVPLLRDGTKAPMTAWKIFQNAAPSESQVREWIQRHGAAIGLVTGFAGIGAIDIDCGALSEEYRHRVVNTGAPDLIESRLFQVETPRPGLHLIYRCAEKLEPSQALAKRQMPEGRTKTLIETREIGSYIVFAYSPSDVHISGKPYKVIEGNYENIPTISAKERQILIDVGRSFSEVNEKPRGAPKPIACSEFHSVAQDFNEKSDWYFLEEYGWKLLKSDNGVEYWQKPNSSNRGHHATINFSNSDLLFVFSSSASPFKERRAYNKFHAYCLLRHAGDRSLAIRQLHAEGFG